MDRRTFYFKQPVTEAELNGAFDAVEQALFHLVSDQGLSGVISAMNGAQVSPTPTLSVTVSGPGAAVDAAGERIFQPNAIDTVVCSQDSSSVSTAVSGGGNERYVSVFIKFKRSASDLRIDGNSNPVYFVENETYQYVVLQGAEAAIGTATKPALDPSMILLFDVHLIHGQTSILNSDISTTRRQDAIVIAGSPLSLRAGSPVGAVSAMLTSLNNHILGVSGAHPASAISTLIESGTRFSLTASDVQTNLAAIQSALDGLKTNGADTVLTFANVAALRAATPHIASGMVGIPGLGIFLWASASTATDDGQATIKESATTTGRWVSISTLLGQASGIAQLNASSKLLEAQRFHWVVDTKKCALGTASPITDNNTHAFVDVFGSTLTFTTECNDGDTIAIRGCACCLSSGGFQFQIVVNDGGTDYVAYFYDTTNVSTAPGAAEIALPIVGDYLVAHSGTGGTCTVRAQIKNLTIGTHAFVDAPVNLVASLIRP